MRPVDIEAVLVDVLPSASTRIPNPRPSAFTRVTRVGGSGANRVMAVPRVLVECFAADSVAAFDDAADAHALVTGLARTEVAGVWVARVEATEPANFPDDETGMARYQFVAQLTVRLDD